MSPTLAVLPGVTLVLVGEPILTPSSNPALRGVNLEVVGETTLEKKKQVLFSVAIEHVELVLILQLYYSNEVK